jgi:hypothetical protein
MTNYPEYPELFQAVKEHNYDSLKNIIKKHGSNLDIIEYRKRAPCYSIFELLLNSYDGINITLIKLKHLCYLAILNNCKLYAEETEFDLISDISYMNMKYTEKIELILYLNKLLNNKKQLSIEDIFTCIENLKNEDERLYTLKYIFNKTNIDNINKIYLENSALLLYFACKMNDYKIVKFLIDKNININKPYNGVLPISVTSSKQITELLLQKGAYINISYI